MIDLILVFICSLIIASIFEKGLKRLFLNIRQRTGRALIKELYTDENGVWQIDLNEIEGIRYEKQYHPVLICNKALELNLEDNAHRDQFLVIADWLTEQIKADKKNFLQYTFPFPAYKMKPPWISALAQGKALEVLIRAHQICDKEIYLHKSQELVSSLFLDHKEGGVTYKTDTEGWWFEEYPSKNGNSPRILNGMMYTLQGLVRYFQQTEESKAKELLDQGILALEKSLPKYDRGGDSYYDKLGNVTNDEYHGIHIEQLGSLSEFSSSKILNLYRIKWLNFQRAPFLWRLIKKPNRINLLVVASVFLVLSILFIILRIVT